MKYFLFLLPLLIVVNVKAQVILETENTYSLDTLLAGSLPDTIKLQLFKKEVLKLPYWASKEPFLLAQKGLDYAESIGDPYYVGDMQRTLGLFYCNTSLYDTSIVLFNLALINFEKEDAIKEQAYCHGILRYLYAQTEDFKKSLEHCYKALKIFEDAGDEEGIGATYNDIAGTLINARRYEEAFPIAKQGRDILLKYENVKELISVRQKIIDCYVYLNNYKRAIDIHNKIIEIVKKDSTKLGLITKIDCYRGRASVYVQTQEYDLAIQDINRAREILFSDPNPDLESSNILKYEEADILLAQKKYREAIPLFKEVIKAEQEANRTNRTHYLNNSLSQAYAGLNQYDSAYHYLLEYERLSLDEKAHETGLQMEELRTKFETQKKEATIFAQEKLLAQQKIIQWFAIGFAGILALLFFQSYRNAKLKKHVNEALLESNAKLESKNKENELLLKEIHHRVKNNLQTVSSLLSLQSESISDKSAYDAVQESKNRVGSMALIHQKLYQGENLAAIEMRDYFETIGEAIIDSFGEKAENISLKVEMKNIELDVDTAVPIGLITNELITNSIKHAFQNKREGQILITLEQEGGGLLKLNIADNGDATAKESVVKKEKGFGALLIQLLTTQLGGKLEKSTEAGTSTILLFAQQEKSAA